MSNKDQDIIISNNSTISENLIKINEKIIKLKSSFIEEEENEYESFYNRINFYFSNIITELKLSFLESIKVYQNREIEMKEKIQSLQEKLEKNNLEKNTYIEEIKKDKKTYAQSMEKLNEKIKKLEEDVLRKNEYLQKNINKINHLNKRNDKTDKDMIEIIIENMILKIELDNLLCVNQNTKIDETQYIDIIGLSMVSPSAKSKEENSNKLTCKDFVSSHLSLMGKAINNYKSNKNINKKNLFQKEIELKNEKSRNKRVEKIQSISSYNNKTVCKPSGVIESEKISNKNKVTYNTSYSPGKNRVMSNFANNNSIRNNYLSFNNIPNRTSPNHFKHEIEKEVYFNTHSDIKKECVVNTKSHSMINNYRKNVNVNLNISKLKELKSPIHSEQSVKNSKEKDNKINNKSFSNIPVMNFNIKNKSQTNHSKNIVNMMDSIHLETEMNKNVGIKNLKNQYIKGQFINTNYNESEKFFNLNNYNKIKPLNENYKFDKKLINSSVEFEKYKTCLLEKLNKNKDSEKDKDRNRDNNKSKGQMNMNMNISSSADNVSCMKSNHNTNTNLNHFSMSTNNHSSFNSKLKK